MQFFTVVNLLNCLKIMTNSNLITFQFLHHAFNDIIVEKKIPLPTVPFNSLKNVYLKFWFCINWLNSCTWFCYYYCKRQTHLTAIKKYLYFIAPHWPFLICTSIASRYICIDACTISNIHKQQSSIYFLSIYG